MADEFVINGWMTEPEQMALRRLAFGLDVLELGSYEGLSTAQLLATANSVNAVDTFDGRGTNREKDTRETFHRNMRATGNYHKLATWPGEFEAVLGKMKERDQTFDLIFIDGSHDFASVTFDIVNSIPLLRPGGKLAFHDYAANDFGVVQAVDPFLATGVWHVHDQVDSILVIGREPSPPRKKIKVAALHPHRDGWGIVGSAWSMADWLSQKYNRQVYNYGTSILTKTFNELLCMVLNDQEKEGFTHLCMLHNDIIPNRYWLDTLIEELEMNNLDFLSAVVPIKNETGCTSTGVDAPGNPWSVRRLTMKEIFELPETFTAYDIPWRQPNQPMVLNSGCWVMRYDQPWMNGLCFRQQDKIAFHTPSGKYVAQSISEDWDFSRQLLSRGCRLGATRKVHVFHDQKVYHNRGVWGTWDTDQDYLADYPTQTFEGDNGPGTDDSGGALAERADSGSCRGAAVGADD